MKSINFVGLFALLTNLKGATIVNLTTESEVKMRKTGNPLIGHNVTKQVNRTCQFGYNYENAVNNRLEKQGGERTFESGSLVWGEWEVFNKIITHKGKRYGRFYTLNSGNDTTSIYFVDGVIADKAQMAIIKEFEIVNKGGSAKQASEGLTENQVKPMAIAFDSIKVIKVNGETYQVHPETETIGA